MTWEDEVVETTVKGLKELGKIPNVVLVHMKDKKTKMYPFPSPEFKEMVRKEIEKEIDNVEEVALIANTFETEVTEEEFRQAKAGNFKESFSVPQREALLIMFETRKDIHVHRFKVENKELKSIDVIKKSETGIVVPFSFGLFKVIPDYGQMYA
jgi:hypothetical protein